MPGLRTLSDLRTQVRRRADMENTNFVSDTEIDQYVQDSWGELYDLIIESSGGEHLVNPQSAAITTVAGTVGYTPVNASAGGDLYKVIRVRAVDGDTTWNLDFNQKLDFASALDVNSRGRPTQYLTTGPQPTSSGASGTSRQVWLHPTPDKAYTVYVQYIPIPRALTTSADVNVQSYTGWDEYVICDAAAKCAEKEESFELSDRLLRRKAAVALRIQWHAQTMSHDGAGQIHDVDASSPFVWRGEPYV